MWDVGGGREVCKSRAKGEWRRNFSNGFTGAVKDGFLTNQGAPSTFEPVSSPREMAGWPLGTGSTD